MKITSARIIKSKKLKPCPFCGSPAVLKFFGYGQGDYMISCSLNCGALMIAQAQTATNEPEVAKEIKKRVIEAWNKRVKP